MEEYETLSCVCEHHECQRVWMTAVGEELRCKRERPQNPRDPYVVVVKKDGITVGHLPHGKFQKCSMLLIIHVKKFHVLNFRNHKTFLSLKLCKLRYFSDIHLLGICL